MAKCKCCGNKGFMVETDVNGLCSACAPYYYLTMPADLKERKKTSRPLSGSASLKRRWPSGFSRQQLERLRPYAAAGLVRLPRPLHELEAWLDEQQAYWQDHA
jgi:hypothetical protein